ncbi:hypothetical protein SAMN05660284_00931 [Formivibrio citricus]|uniref:DUF2065 domain-containing protein n=1 Tax=Formivibrio citricus TaxID=83765 RepID=A0A1I4XAI2_9NEIS|nr:DUF2065 domain-containing protein [Formivibrio citricus]SFN22917.1 hypothetical protein SAMN05660284_00931 [Formivibrio citricus]
MSKALVMALALMLVFEGIMPFVAPSAWREILGKLAGMSDTQARSLGFSLLMGALLIALFFA